MTGSESTPNEFCRLTQTRFAESYAHSSLGSQVSITYHQSEDLTRPILLNKEDASFYAPSMLKSWQIVLFFLCPLCSTSYFESSCLINVVIISSSLSF